MPSAVKAWSPNHWTAREVSGSNFNIPYMHKPVDVETLFSITFGYFGGYFLCKVIKKIMIAVAH